MLKLDKHILGSWYSLSNPDKKVNGTLSQNENNQIRLELFDSLSNGSIGFSSLYDFIIGDTNEYGVVILVDCYETIPTVNLHDDRYPSTTRVTFALLGCDSIDLQANLVPTSIELDFYDLRYWINKFQEPCFETDYNPEKQEITAKYSIPEDISIYDCNDFNLKIAYKTNYTIPAHMHDGIKVNSIPIIEFSNKANIKIKEVFTKIYNLIRFLNLTWGVNVPLKTAQIYFDKTKVNFISSAGMFYQEKNYDKFQSFPITFFEIKNDLQVILDLWFDLFTDYDFSVLLNIYFEQFDSDVKVLPGFFSDHAKILERLIEKHCASEKIQRQEIQNQALQDLILNFIDNEHKSYSETDREFYRKKVIGYPTYKERFQFLYNKILSDFIILEPTLIDSIVENRNYYTHLSRGKKRKILTDSELFILGTQIRFIIQLLLLIELKLSPELINKFLDSCRNWYCRPLIKQKASA